MMDRYNWQWVEAQVESTMEVWDRSATPQPPSGPAYSFDEHCLRERTYDAGLRAVEQEAQRLPRTAAERTLAQNRLTATFARFAGTALGLESETVNLLTDDFLPTGIRFAQLARRFDAQISRADTIQACRNAWTACGLQPLLGVPAGVTPSILAYSLLYPYTDNYLDSQDVPAATKLTFSRRFRERLRGRDPSALNQHEAAVWALVAMIEGEYPRTQYPQVFDCLLAIHQAQEDSLIQLRNCDQRSASELLKLSLAKGGTSVLADACLVRGCLTLDEIQFAFLWGALLQLGDDLQDVREDLRAGSDTLFTRAALQGVPLDSLVRQLLNFCELIGAGMEGLPHGSARLKSLLKMSWRSLILGAVADAHEFFSPAFILEAERSSPFRFEFLRERRKKLSSRQGLYTVLFDLFVEARDGAITEPLWHFDRPTPCFQPVI